MIKFMCWNPNENIVVKNRKEALDLIRKNKFDKYSSVCVWLDNGEKFALHSARSKEYFGIKR